MNVTEARVVIPRSPQEVYTKAQDIEALAKAMPDVKSIKFLVKEPNHTVVEWVGVTHGRTIRWTEIDLWNPKTLTCVFHQTEGAFDHYEGSWTFRETPQGGTEFIHHLEWELSIPLLGPLLKGVIKRAVQENSDAIAKALAKICETP
ncbi:MAG: SRPBCC family protein [Parcubacteria group bacterium]|nr:SRPBCC family protein [Parcubacteria group bacterium]